MKHPETFLARGIAVALLLLGLDSTAVHGSRSARDAALLSAAATPPDVCEFKTINYITHTLPQQCFRTAWTGPSSATATETTATATGAQEQAPEATDVQKTGDQEKNDTGQALEADKEQENQPDFASGSFMSFEEWKEMMIRKSGQDPAKIKDYKPSKPKGGRDTADVDPEPESIGEEGEIQLNFESLQDKVSELASPPSGEPPASKPEEAGKEAHVLAEAEDGKTQYYRSKDAGKTCKERFSFSSAGASVLKTGPGTKNRNAILTENKDTYMLLECNNKNKFVIVELNDDVLIDTIVLANFEFFSSMIRKFRASVSDRWPVKPDKWVELGTFEARNSRDIQPFLVEHPRIYTKYLRIEFLTHYGKEYYCPVSLLRVHGTRMLDTWKDHQDEEPEGIDPPPEAVAESNNTETAIEAPASATAVEAPSHTPAVAEVGLSLWQPTLYFNDTQDICHMRSPTTCESTPVDGAGKAKPPTAQDGNATTDASQATAAREARQPPASPAPASQQPPSPPSQAAASPQQDAHNSSTSNPPGSKPSAARADGTHNPPQTATPATTPTTRNKTNAASSAASASPTVQESFFKQVNKRLTLLESNTSLSLQYIEEQSRFLRETLHKMEAKQASRVDAFLDRLNNTVLSELRTVRTQYDQIWQSTVLALETQREQSQREVVALSGRLAVLADEVVFQKRMAILQSVLLLSCLVLVIFSRGGGGGGNASATGSFSFRAAHQPTSSLYAGSHYRQDSSSLSAAGGGGQTPLSGPNRNHQGGGKMHGSPQYHGGGGGEKALPLTPTSQLSREGTPLIHVEAPFYGDMSPSPPQIQSRRRVLGADKMEAGIEEEDEQEPGLMTPPARDGSPGEDDPDSSRPSLEDVAVEQDSAKTLLNGHGRPSHQQRAVRKPLPALPEDPS